MSNDTAKYINSRRRHKNDVAIARQVRIAKQHGLGFHDKAIKEPHRLAKHHAMDCGQPGCVLCGNPRRNTAYKSERLTAQERRMFQDVEKTTDKHSNGLSNNTDE
jgi:hypothetical protein